jgi:hypothetical protein
MKTWLLNLIGTVHVLLVYPPTRDERGLSQSTENAILLAGAVAIAGIIITAITAYVKGRLPA